MRRRDDATPAAGGEYQDSQQRIALPVTLPTQYLDGAPGRRRGNWFCIFKKGERGRVLPLCC